MIRAYTSALRIVNVTVADGSLVSTQVYQVNFADPDPPTLSVSANNGTGAGSAMTTLPHGTPATATLTPSTGTTYAAVQVEGYNVLYSVEQQLDLMAPPGTSNYFVNARGAGEEYLISGNGSNPAGGGYYVLLPNGNLYAWAGSLTASEANPPSSLGTAAYDVPTLLTDPAPGYTPIAYNTEQTLDLMAPPGTANYDFDAPALGKSILSAATAATRPAAATMSSCPMAISTPGPGPSLPVC